MWWSGRAQLFNLTTVPLISLLQKMQTISIQAKSVTPMAERRPIQTIRVQPIQPRNHHLEVISLQNEEALAKSRRQYNELVVAGKKRLNELEDKLQEQETRFQEMKRQYQLHLDAEYSSRSKLHAQLESYRQHIQSLFRELESLKTEKLSLTEKLENKIQRLCHVVDASVLFNVEHHSRELSQVTSRLSVQHWSTIWRRVIHASNSLFIGRQQRQNGFLLYQHFLLSLRRHQVKEACVDKWRLNKSYADMFENFCLVNGMNKDLLNVNTLIGLDDDFEKAVNMLSIYEIADVLLDAKPDEYNFIIEELREADRTSPAKNFVTFECMNSILDRLRKQQN